MSRLEVAGMAERVAGAEHMWCVPQLCQEMSPTPSRRTQPGVQEMAGAALVCSGSSHGPDLFHYPIFLLCQTRGRCHSRRSRSCSGWEVGHRELSSWANSGLRRWPSRKLGIRTRRTSSTCGSSSIPTLSPSSRL